MVDFPIEFGGLGVSTDLGGGVCKIKISIAGDFLIGILFDQLFQVLAGAGIVAKTAF